MCYSIDTITAGELRDRRFQIPDHIPDCATTTNNSWIVSFESITQDLDGTVRTSFSVTFLDAFRWIEGTYRVEDKVGNVEKEV
jgi:hypothetical protein